MEAEFIALSATGRFTRSVEHLVIDLLPPQAEFDWDLEVYSDNNAALEAVKMGGSTGAKSRHISLALHFTKSLPQYGYKVERVDSAENPADLLTKVIGGVQKLYRLRNLCGLSGPSA